MKYYKYDEEKDVIYFGMYPQNQVKDENLSKALNDELYRKCGKLEFNEFKGPFMDIEFGNTIKTKYRGTDCPGGYFSWFKFEPIEWKILYKDKEEALIITNSIIDSRSYASYKRAELPVDYQGNFAKKKFAHSNYKYSFIRSWLNTDFYKYAFNLNEQKIIKTSLIDNKSKYLLSVEKEVKDPDDLYSRTIEEQVEVLPELLCENTKDKIFLLSYNEILSYLKNPVPDLEIYDRMAKSSSYAWILNIYDYKSSYWLRSPEKKDAALIVDNEGNIRSFDVRGNFFRGIGVRPACVIKL